MKYNLIAQCFNSTPDNFLITGHIYEARFDYDKRTNEYRLIIKHDIDTGVCMSISCTDYQKFVKIF